MSFRAAARSHPNKPATIIAGTGETSTYAQLEARSMQVSQLLSAAGLRPGDAVAVMMETLLEYHEVVWGVLRSEMYLVTVNRGLTAHESAYIINNSEARALFVSDGVSAAGQDLVDRTPRCQLRLSVGVARSGFHSYEQALKTFEPRPARERERMGDWMLYSSGTTGLPLGIRRPLSGEPFDSVMAVEQTARDIYQLSGESVFLVPAPLHHSAPLCYSTATHALGGTNVMMPRFDAVTALETIEQFGVTVGQWVPSMFVRMLKLPEERRDAYDVGSQLVAVHGAAPCPPEVKRAMIDWWGPTLVEVYGSTEFAGLTACTANEWLERPGTVGRPVVGELRICDETGHVLPPNQDGLVYFAREQPAFEYYKAPERTQQAQHPEHPTWTQVGDIGHVDAEGYLYLTDRVANLIITGGTNVYPQEIENVFQTHPAVQDVAVFGMPHPELGEQVTVAVELVQGWAPSAKLAEELREFASARLASYKLPRTTTFVARLPREDTGKLYKRLLRDLYASADPTVRSAIEGFTFSPVKRAADAARSD